MTCSLKLGDTEHCIITSSHVRKGYAKATPSAHSRHRDPNGSFVLELVQAHATPSCRKSFSFALLSSKEVDLFQSRLPETGDLNFSLYKYNGKDCQLFLAKVG